MHRRLGVAGAVLAATMVVAGARGSPSPPPRRRGAAGNAPLAFLVIPLFDLVLFAGFAPLRWWRDANKEAHKRLMLLAYVSIITAAIARLPGCSALGPPAFFGLSLLFVTAGAIYDFVSRGRVHKVYRWAARSSLLPSRCGWPSPIPSAWRSLAKLLTGSIKRSDPFGHSQASTQREGPALV